MRVGPKSQHPGLGSFADKLSMHDRVVHALILRHAKVALGLLGSLDECLDLRVLGQRRVNDVVAGYP